jgi:hypothetical protein
MMGVRIVNRSGRWIGHRLNILGIRVWGDACQLVARNGTEWIPLGPPRELPVQIPRNAEELRAAASDPLRLTAYQYVTEHPGSDLAELLAKRKDFETALQSESAASASR